MRFHLALLSGATARALAISTLVSASAFAAPADYRFEVVQARSVGPGETELTLRVVHVPDGKPVVGAVLFQTKTDMGPSGMGEMSGKVTPLKSDQPGLYRLQAETGMAGEWALRLAAKVQGEPGTVSATVNYDVVK